MSFSYDSPNIRILMEYQHYLSDYQQEKNDLYIFFHKFTHIEFQDHG